MKKEQKIKLAIMSLCASSAITTIIALALGLFGIPTNVILPTSAPIWMGFMSLSIMVIG